jgi:SAM-dependent methyltransferase
MRGSVKHRIKEVKGMATSAIDEAKLEAFMGQAVTDMGAIISAPLFVIGEKLGLYKAMAHAGPLTSQEVADRAGVAERSVREWLRNQAAGGYVEYDPETDTYTLPNEQAMALADEDSPVYVLGVYDSIASLYADEDKILEAFKSGGGMGWHEHDPRLFHGTERFFRPGYRAHLVAEWIPALDGVTEKLEAGAKVADVGCGHGASTVIMAEAFPNSEFTGIDYHEASIEQARERAESARAADRVKFEVGSAQDYAYPEGGYDLVCVCLPPPQSRPHVETQVSPDRAESARPLWFRSSSPPGLRHGLSSREREENPLDPIHELVARILNPVDGRNQIADQALRLLLLVDDVFSACE